MLTCFLLLLGFAAWAEELLPAAQLWDRGVSSFPRLALSGICGDTRSWDTDPATPKAGQGKDFHCSHLWASPTELVGWAGV